MAVRVIVRREMGTLVTFKAEVFSDAQRFDVRSGCLLLQNHQGENLRSFAKGRWTEAYVE